MRRIAVICSLLTVVVAGVVVMTVGGLASGGGGHDAAADWSAPPSPTLVPSPSPSLVSPPAPVPSQRPAVPTLRAPKRPSAVKVKGATLFGWALLDTAAGTIVGSSNDESTRNTVESMIKGWIAADFLRRADAGGKEPSKRQLDDITLMIIDSNNKIAQEYYVRDGQDASITRLISICGLRNVKVRHDYWSYTEMTPADAARYGECLRDGRAAGPQWTDWLLEVMTKVRGDVDDQISDVKQGGRWGIIDGLPKSIQDGLSMKNGWTKYKDGWHVNCLGIEPGWVLSVMVRTDTLPHAAADCASVARQLVVAR